MKTNNIGLYRIVLLPEAEPETFEQYMLTQVFPETNFYSSPSVLLTHRLLKYRFRQYAWMINAECFADDEFSFAQYVSDVQDKIAAFGLCISLDTFVEIGEPIMV